MNIKMADFLFEEEEKEEVKGITIEGNIKSLSK